MPHSTPDSDLATPPAPRAAPWAASGAPHARSLARGLARWTLGLAALLIVAAIGTWWVLLHQIVPKIGQWREPIAQQASSLLGVPVRIGQLTGRSVGWVPELTLNQVELLDPQGRTALKLPQISARLSASSLWPQSLWRREIHIDQLTLIRPQLDIRRDRQGKLHIAGLVLDLHQARPGDGRNQLDWLMEQTLIRIDQGRITWTDELRGAPTLQLGDLNLSMRNGRSLVRRTHEWQLDATPPREFGQRFSLRAHLTQNLWTRGRVATSEPSLWAGWWGSPTRASDWRTWSGRWSAQLPWVDVQSLRRHADLPFELQGGRGRLHASLDMTLGQPQQVSLDVDVQAVSLRLAKHLSPLAFQRLQGHLEAQHEPTRTQVAWKGLTFKTDEGLTWPASQARLQWTHAAATVSDERQPQLLPELQGEAWDRTKEGQLDIDRLDLTLLARLADRLPLSPTLRAQLGALSPTGIAQNLRLTWQGPALAPTGYQAEGVLQGVSWLASSEHPGVAGAELTFQANQAGGQAQAKVRQGWVEFPGVFDEPRVPVRQLDAQLQWQIRPRPGAQPEITLNVQQAKFANDDATGVLNATWRTGDGQGLGDGGRFPGHLRLSGELAQARGDRVWRYLPSVILVDARHYVRDAIRQGTASKVQFSIDGDLWHFPFANDQGGRFRVQVPMQDVTLDYVPFVKKAAPGQLPTPYWPAFTQLGGQLIFEGQRMRIEGATALISDVGSGSYRLREVSGVIDDLAADDPVLRIEGRGMGPLDDLLRYMAASPVGPWTDHILSQAQGRGNAALSLALDIPLNRVEQASVKGQVTLTDKDGAGLKLSPSVPWMTQARGQIQFTQDSIKAQANTKVWGHDIKLTGERDAQGVPRFVATGLVSGEGLRSAHDWPALAQLAQHMTGQSPLTVTVALNKARTGKGLATPAVRPELLIQSSLQGLAIDLPAPLNKPAADAWPLKLTHRSEGPDGKGDRLTLELGAPQPWLIDYRRDTQGATATVRQGLWQIGSPSGGTSAADRVTARVQLPLLDLDAWQKAFDQRPAVPANADAGASLGELDDYLPDLLQFRAHDLVWKQRHFKDMAVTLTRPSPQIWRAQVDAPLMSGQIDVRQEGSGRKVVARLSRLSVPTAEADALTQQGERQLLGEDTPSVPALDIVIDQLEWRGLPLGRLEVDAANRLLAGSATGTLTEWRLSKLKLSSPEATLTASGNWAPLGAQGTAPTVARNGPRHRAAFNFNLNLNNSGQLLTRLGLPQTLKGGKGRMDGQVSWLGSPLAPDTASLTGDVKVAIEEGQFLKVDPGMAKLLGVLSLQSLPRRLILDFRDVFQQGFAFDRIDGDVKITQGVADTRNLRMRGVQAVVLMEGQADLAQETQNLRVFVVPDINAGTASLAYAAINPAIGLGTFIAQVLLRKTVVEASTREFTIKGPWADPQVERVQKTSVPAALDGPTPAPSSPNVGPSNSPPGSAPTGNTPTKAKAQSRPTATEPPSQP